MPVCINTGHFHTGFTHQVTIPEHLLPKQDISAGDLLHTRRYPEFIISPGRLTILGFQAVPSDFPTVKKRFRRAVMNAHPDRGGKTETIQDLNQAFAVLKAHFRHNI